ncbi:MAG TPA: creatininase family protein [Candidatus Latescibacteria bacterium]|jgi:creatinine amidohydrolase|nr:amidase [Gemmatimonadaceae bacterium]MDP6015117.1 creatininase family protein [Candidatus Latescibacterota bacterium]HJP34103.1 creatininase family protein [Candidatus Latescibacterota bacterium]
MASTPVRYTDLRPHQFRERIQDRPVAYLPLGTIEWHGEHLPLGSDAIISEGLMCECARRFGGIVMPPVHLGPDRTSRQPDGGVLVGMDTAEGVTDPHRQLDGSCYWVSQGLFLQIIDAILSQLQRAGFRTVFADGHGPSRSSWVANLAEREQRFGLKLLGVTTEVRDQWRSQMDHAARNETSLVMALRPELADLSCLDADRNIWPQGVGGEDPRDATADEGRRLLEASIPIVGRLLDAADAST